ncbi:MAG: isochorismate synthase [Desulfobacula sp.]|nr:isochorismate synthase [Desulfobacula sp.]
MYAPFHYLTNYPVVFFEPEVILDNKNGNEDLLKQISLTKKLYPDHTPSVPFEISKEAYIQQVKKSIGSFGSRFRKAVLSRAKIFNKQSDFNEVLFFERIQHAYPETFCHLIHIPGNGTWVGATPEILFKMNKDQAQLYSLAGTQAKQTDKKNNIWGKKDTEEQQIVSEYIESVLQKFNIIEYHKDKVQTISAGESLHLATSFFFNSSLLQNRVKEFLTVLHPTPAICGLPKDNALSLILATEKHNREYYAGYCGPMNVDGKSDLFVNLRCMKILENSLILYAGGGLTALSDPEKEWAETELKMRTLSRLINVK